MSCGDHKTRVSSGPVYVESDAPTAHYSHVEVDADLSHAHPEANEMTVLNKSHTQCKTDDFDQDVVATSNSDAVLTHADQEVVATSNSDMEPILTDQEVVATTSNTVPNNDTSDGLPLGISVRDQENYKMSREAVGYHIERLQEDQESSHDNTLQDNTVVDKNNAVIKDENVTANNTSNEEETIIGVTSSQNDKIDTATGKKVDDTEQEDIIHPFLPEQPLSSRQESITHADFTSLFKKCIDDMATRKEHRKELFGEVSPQPKEVDHQPKEPVKEDELIASSTTDIWGTISPCPSRLGAKRMATTGRILWVMDSKGTTYWYSPTNDQWHTEKQNMEYISSSPSGSVVWGLYKGQPYTRKGITKNLPQGQSWHKVGHELMKLIAVGESCVWTVNQDDKLMCRQGVSSLSPEGFQWKHTQFKASFAKSITFCDDVLWACDAMGTVYALNTADGLSHAQWETVSGCLLENMSLTKGGIIWGVEQQSGTVFFQCGITPTSPCGIGPWWEVSTAQPVYQETSFVGSLANKVTSVVPGAITHHIDSISNRVSNSMPVSFIKNTISSFIDNGNTIKKIAASSQDVWVLDGKGVIRYCRGIVTGNRYIAVSSLELMKVSLWTQVSAMSSVPLNQDGLVWALRSTKELFCFDKEGAVKQVEYPLSVIKQVATSSTAVWIVTNKGIYAREGVSKRDPKGTEWTKIDMGPLQNGETVLWLSCGKKVVWLVNSLGSMFMRVGVHSTVKGSSLAPAWVEVDTPCPLAHVVVGTEDWLVWACDTNHNVYVRTGITDAFPIGTKWELVLGCKAINLCCSASYVWAVCPGGEVLCRFGVKQNNVMGDYWKCIAGHFCQISATLCGQLWVVNEKGRLLKRVTHLLSISEPKTLPEMENADEWDVL